MSAAMPSSSGSASPARRDDFIVEWYRPDQRRALVRVAALGGTVLAFAAITIGLVRTGHLDSWPTWRWTLGLLGAVGVLTGPLIGVFGFHALVVSDAYLAIRGDGVYRQVGRRGPDAGRLVRWDALLEARFDAAQGLVLELQDGALVPMPERYQDVSPEELAARINRARQRALLGLLRPTR